MKFHFMDAYHTMWLLACHRHEGQKYGNAFNYIDHIGEVIAETRKILHTSYIESIPVGSGLYWSTLTIAAGHDLVEDTSVTLDFLRKECFNGTIVSGIDAITKREGEDLTAYIGRVNESTLVTIVKKADSLCNLSHSIRGQDTRRIDKYLNTLGLLHN